MTFVNDALSLIIVSKNVSAIFIEVNAVKIEGTMIRLSTELSQSDINYVI